MQKRFSSALEKNRFFVVFFRFENSQGLFLTKNIEHRTKNLRKLKTQSFKNSETQNFEALKF